MTREEIIEIYPDDEFLFADGFDDCILGVDSKSLRIIYSIESCIAKLQSDHGMERAEAYEYFDFNIFGAYVGELTPIWCE